MFITNQAAIGGSSCYFTIILKQNHRLSMQLLEKRLPSVANHFSKYFGEVWKQ